MTTYAIVAALVLSQAAPSPAPLAAPQPGAPGLPPPAAAPAAPGAPRADAPAAGPVLSLDVALREAQARSLDLQVARARLDQSRELSNRAWSFSLPQVTAGATYTHNQLPDVAVQFPTGFAIRNCDPAAGGAPCPPAPPPTTGLPGAPTTLAVVPTGVLEAVIQKQDQLAAQLQATQALFAPQAWYGIAAARAGERLADASVENTRREILFGVAQAYYGAAGLKQVVKIQERQLAIGLDRERDARVRYEAGTTAKVALLRAEIDRARAEQDLKRAQNSHLSAKLALAALLDRDDAAFEVEIPASPQVPGAEAPLEEAALRDRPDLRAAQEQVTVNERNRDATVARYLPTLGAFGRYVYSNASGFGGQSTTWAVGLALNWNILDGFLRESDLRENRARVREAQAARQAAEVRARTEVRQARLELESALANREKAKEQAELARENQRLVDVNYRAGAATYLEVSDANAALLSAELSAVNEALSADLSALRLLRAAGAFDPK